MKRTGFMLLAVLFMAFTILAGCSSKDGKDVATQAPSAAAVETPSPTAEATPVATEAPHEPVKLRIGWWGSQERHDATNKVIELFKAKYPYIEIETQFAGYGGYMDKLAVQSAGNDLPDVIQLTLASVNQYSSKNLLADLDGAAADGTLNLGDVSQAIADSGKIGGKLYGVSLGTNAIGIIYNPEMVAKAGIKELNPNWTWAEFEKTIMDMKAALGKDSYGGGAVWAEDFGYYLRTFGKTLYNADGTALGYDDDKLFTDFLGMNLRLTKAKAVPSLQDYSTVKGLEDEFIVRGTAPFVDLYSNAVVALSAAAKKDFKLTFLPSGTEPGHWLNPAMFFSVAENSKVKKEAAMFIDFMTNDIEANKILLAERGVPISGKVADAILPLLNPAQQELVNYVGRVANNSKPMDPPDPVGAAEVVGVISSLAEQIYFEKITVDAAAKEFRKQANDILAKNKK